MGLFDDYLNMQNSAGPIGGLLNYFPTAAFTPGQTAGLGPLDGVQNYGQQRNVDVGGYQMPQFGNPSDPLERVRAIAGNGPGPGQSSQMDANAQMLPANGPLPQPGQMQPGRMGVVQPEDPSIGDRLLAGFTGFGSGGRQGGLIGALTSGVQGLATGQRTDPQAVQQQQLKNTFQALVNSGVPSAQALAVVQSGNAELLKQTLEKYGKQDRFRPATADERKAAGLTETGGPLFMNTATGEPKFGPQQTNVNVSTEKTGQAELAKRGVDAYVEAQTAGRDSAARIRLYDTMEKAADGFKTGATAEARLTAKRYLRDAGIIKGEDVPDGEVLQMLSRQLAIGAQPKGQGAVSNYERSLYASALPGLTQTPEGLKTAISISRKLEQWDIEASKIYRDSARKNNGLPNYLEVQDKLAELGNPLSVSERAAIGGDSGKSAAPATPAAAPTLRYNTKTRQMEPVK
jgi:hypothetical protein